MISLKYWEIVNGNISKILFRWWLNVMMTEETDIAAQMKEHNGCGGK